MKNKEYFYALNGWRFIFSLLIVLHHMPKEWRPNVASWDFGNTIVLFFFILSGFLLTVGYKDKIQNRTVSYKDFVIKRVSSILPLQMLMTLLFVLFGINVVTYWAVPFHLTLTQSLLPFWEINFTLNTPSWFLSSIFICYLLVWPVLVFARNRRRTLLIYLLVVLAWSVFVFLLPGSVGTRWLCYINPFARFIDFSAGVVLALYWDEIKLLFKRLRQHKLLFTLCELVIIAFVVCCFVSADFQKYNNYTIIRQPLICLFIVIFALGNGWVSKIFGSNMFNKLGDLAIAIYMCHGFILYFIQIPAFENNSVSIILTYIFTILFSYILVHFYCPVVQKFMVGLLSKKNK